MTVAERALVEVAGGVWVATSRKDSTTSTVIVQDAEVMLVDPSWLPDELAGLVAWLTSRDLHVSAGFSTHAHHDHLLWHPDFGDASRWASERTCELALEHRDELLDMLGDWPWPDCFGLVSPAPSLLTFGTESFEVITHDGHAPGHSALWLPGRGVMVAGDMLSDVELPLPYGADNLPAYLKALDLLAPYVAEARVLIPGHGTPTDDPMARLNADRRYLEGTIAGRVVDDPRLTNPGMATIHADLVESVRG